ncbi:MAG: helix-turn-helix domain-containing protein [Lachnospiraceae bacterium]|nr:helix-turn-helix domain-containing protein [Lachnospiraceae bacterium]
MIHLITDIPMIHYEMYYFSGQQTLIHETTRFLCLLSGRLSVLLPDCRYPMAGGDLLYLPEETEYRLNASDAALILYVEFHPYFMQNALGRSRHRIQPFYCDTQPEQRTALSTRIASLISRCLIQDPENTCSVYAEAYELLDYLCRHCMTPPPQLQGQGFDKTAAKLRQLEEYLSGHYTEALSLNDAARALGYTPQYLSSFVKKHLQLTFQDYLNQFRLDTARVLLRYSAEPLNKIAMLSGFPNQGSFLHSFEKEAKRTAEDFRLEMQAAKELYGSPFGILITNASLVLDYIFNYMNYTPAPNALYKAALREQEEILLVPDLPVKPIWRFLINLGSAGDYEKPAFRNQLTELQAALHFTYGRCTEVFSLVRIYLINGKKTYDFSRLFRLIDFMRSIGLKPFFDIDVKPFCLYKAPDENPVDYRTYLSTEAYDAFFYEILPVFVKSCITRYGFDEFYTWRFELWRRYNVNLSSLEPPEVFAERFQKTAGIIKELAPETCLGGPGFNGFLSSHRLLELLRPLAGSAYPPDFISAYYFPYSHLPGDNQDAPSGYRAVAAFSTMEGKLREWKSILGELGFSQTPLYVTEYSAHISLENYVNDSTYPATYIFHQAIQNLGVVDGLGFWLATDLSLEYGTPNSPLFGGNGLLTKNGIPKPAYYAHDFLNLLGSRLLKRGAHYIATVSPEDCIQILAYHCGNLKQSFASSPMNRELLHYPYSAFEDTKPLRLALTLKELIPGRYRIREYSMDLNHGNVLHIWGQLNHSVSITPDEVQYLKAKSIPFMQIHTEELEDSYVLQTTLNINEAKLYLLEPYR